MHRAADHDLRSRARAWVRPSALRRSRIGYNGNSEELLLALTIRLVSLERPKELGAAWMGDIVFEIHVDDMLSTVTSAAELKSCVNKRLLSFINDFEDGKWRHSKFQSYLWDNIAETALSQRERAALANHSHSTLVAAARNLRLTDKDEIGQGSEIAEVFLYGVMKHHFDALPVVPKIFYKQNSQDNAKGADSVHIVVSDNDFTLWFGEAKFYNSIADARLDSIVSSVTSALSTNKLRKENSIITNVSDLDEVEMDPELRAKIKSALSPKESIDGLKSRIHVPILLLHECGLTGSASEVSQSYKDNLRAIYLDRDDAYFKKQYARSGEVFKYDDVTFHLILFPVPEKKKVVDAFLDAVKFYKGEA